MAIDQSIKALVSVCVLDIFFWFILFLIALTIKYCSHRGREKKLVAKQDAAKQFGQRTAEQEHRKFYFPDNN